MATEEGSNLAGELETVDGLQPWLGIGHHECGSLRLTSSDSTFLADQAIKHRDTDAERPRGSYSLLFGVSAQ
jgi:hypothetical protein